MVEESKDESASAPASLAKIQRQLNAGSVTVALLALLERAGQPMYGYELSKILEQVTSGPLPMKQGTLYPVLRSLEREGLLESSLQPSESGPPRRYYQVTEEGHEVSQMLEGAWHDIRSFVDGVLDGRDHIRTVLHSAREATSSKTDSPRKGERN